MYLNEVSSWHVSFFNARVLSARERSVWKSVEVDGEDADGASIFVSRWMRSWVG